jgi:hypothetical protein
MLRLNGWNPRGERLVSDAPMGHWETVTFIAGLRQTGVVAPMLSATARLDSRRRSFASATKGMSTAPALWFPFRRLAA